MLRLIYIILSFLTLSTICNSQDQSLELRISSEQKTLHVKEIPKIKIEIINQGQEAVTLVRPGDGSTSGWRTPLFAWSSKKVGENKEHNFIGSHGGMRCGNVNPLSRDEIINLRPGEVMILGTWVSSPRPFVSQGKHEIVFNYKNDPELEWKGIPLGSHPPELMEEVRKSTKCELKSNKLIFEVIDTVFENIRKIGFEAKAGTLEGVNVNTIETEGGVENIVRNEKYTIIGCWNPNKLIVLNYSLNKVTELELDTFFNVNLQEHRVCSPGEMVIVGNKLIVDQSFGENLLVYDLNTFKIIHRIPIGGEGKLIKSNDESKLYYYARKKKKLFQININDFAYHSLKLPKDVWVNSMGISQDGQKLYLGINKKVDTPEKPEKTSGILIYDVEKKKYTSEISLETELPMGLLDTYKVPYRIIENQNTGQLYIGMFQAYAGLKIIDLYEQNSVEDIIFKPKGHSTRHWANPLFMNIYRNWLICANRENHELIMINLKDWKKAISIPLGFAPQPMTLKNDQLIIGDEKGKRLLLINIDELIEKQK